MRALARATLLVLLHLYIITIKRRNKQVTHKELEETKWVGQRAHPFRLARRDGDAMVSPARSLKNELESVEILV